MYIAIIVILVGLGGKESIKHLKGEGGCCGGSATKPKSKRLKGKVVKTYVLKVTDMHCQNCANSIISAVNDIEGASAKVNLSKKTVIVRCDRDIDIELITNKIENRGYTIDI